MKKVITIGLCLLVAFACKDEKKDADVAEARQVSEYTIEQFMDNENAFANGYSADKTKVLMTSNRSGIYNMYTVPTTGGELKPLTQSDSASDL